MEGHCALAGILAEPKSSLRASSSVCGQPASGDGKVSGKRHHEGRMLPPWLLSRNERGLGLGSWSMVSQERAL